MFAKDPETKAQSYKDLHDALSWLNEVLSKNNRGPYFAAGRSESQGPGMLDYNIWPFTPMLRLFNEVGVAEIAWEKYPNFVRDPLCYVMCEDTYLQLLY